MLNAAYTIIEKIADINVSLASLIGNSLIYIVQLIATGYIKITSFVFYGILSLLNKKRVEHTVTVTQQVDDLNELHVLSVIDNVKKAVVSRGYWTPLDADCLNSLGSRLYHEFNWTEDRIREYLETVLNGFVMVERQDPNDFD